MFTLIIEDKHGGIADEYSFDDGEFYIGRSHTSDIILPSDNVSRRHARLYTVDGKCYIEDLNSSNGVFVNGRRIHEVFQIQRSAQIKVGDYYLHIESDAEAAADEEKTYCKLTGRNLGFAGQVFRIQRKVSLIGRGKDCTVTIIDPSVSRIHAKLSVERSGSLTVEDLKSSNSTFLNDERVEVGTVHHKDVLRFGNVEFLVELADGASEVPQERTSTSAPSKPRTSERGRDKDRDREKERDRDREKERDRDREKERDRDRDKNVDRPIRESDGKRARGRVKDDDDDAPVRTGTLSTSVADAWNPGLDAGGDKGGPKAGPLLYVGIILGAFVVMAAVLLFAFRDEIFGSKEPAQPGGATAPTHQAGGATATTPSEDPAKAAERDREKKKAEIAGKLATGSDRLKNSQWDLAIESFQGVLDLDPLNDDARRGLNHVKAWKSDKDALEKARGLANALKRGDAARLLHGIDAGSPYFEDAKGELIKIGDSLPTLKLLAQNLLSQKDCTGALNQLKEVQVIAPSDAEVGAKIDEIQKLVGTRRCLK